MKLIDTDRILEALGAFTDKKHGDQHFLNGIETAREIVEQMSEEVVRCGDCRNRPPEGYCDFYLDGMQDNDFCSYGERRTDDA